MVKTKQYYLYAGDEISQFTGEVEETGRRMEESRKSWMHHVQHEWHMMILLIGQAFNFRY